MIMLRDRFRDLTKLLGEEALIFNLLRLEVQLQSDALVQKRTC